MINKILLDPLRRVFNAPKKVSSFVKEDVGIKKATRFTCYPSIYRDELIAIIKELQGTPLTSQEKERLTKENVKISKTKKENPDRVFSVVDKERRSGKTLLACVYSLYTLYQLTFQKDGPSCCIELYGATFKQTRFSLKYLMEDLVHNTPSLRNRIYITFDIVKGCCRVSPYSTVLYAKKKPVVTILDDVNLFSEEKRRRIFEQNHSSDFLLTGTLKEDNNEKSNQELYLESCPQ